MKTRQKIIILFALTMSFISGACKKDYVFDSPYDPDNKLGAPTDFTVTISADTMAVVSWKYIRPDVAFVFTAEISGDGNTWQKLGEVVKVTALTAKYNFQAGKTYSFRVQAAADQNRSEYGITQAAAATFGALSELTVSFPADTMAALNWKDNSSYETGFEIERSADGLNYSLVKTADANTVSAGTGYNYEAGKTYSFRVRATSAANKSGYSNTVNWGLMKPAAPDLASPDDGVIDISESPTLIWKPGGDATSYKLEVAVSSSFTNPVYSKNVGTATSQTVSGLSYLTPYYWRVTALNRYGESPSVARKFTTRGTAPPYAPTLLLPGNGATDQSVTPALSWNAVNGATSYNIQVATENSFLGTSLIVNENAGNTTGRQLSGLSNSQTYYWKVAAVNQYGTSGWSGVYSFTTTGTASGAPTLSLPNNGATDQSITPTLSWNAVSGAASYNIQVATDNSFSEGHHQYEWWGSLVYNQSGITNTSQQVTGLNNAVTYYWRVNVANSYGTSGWSGVWSFTTAAASQFTCGKSTVTYSGKTYNTVQIGSQCWLKENLDIGTMVNGSGSQANNGTTEKYCYNNDPANCATYGGLYQWDEAMGYSTTAGSKGICPTGWHIPTDAEYQTLKTAVNNDGNALKAVGQGNASYGGAGTNTSGFSALLAGYRGYGDYFGNLAYYSYYWSSTVDDAASAFIMSLGSNGSNIYRNLGSRSFGFSVRCVED